MNVKKVLSIVLVLLLILSVTCCDKDSGAGSTEKPKIAAADNSNELTAAKLYCKENDGEIVKYSDVYDAVTAAENGIVDYVVLDEYTAASVINNGASLEMCEKCTFTVDYCAYFSKGNEKLCDAFNSVIKELAEDGVIDEIKDCHKSGGTYEIASSVKADEEIIMLCDPIFENTLYYNDSGVVSGVDLDIAKAVCARLGYSLTIKTVGFEEIFLSLDAGDGDLIISGTEYTEERAADYCASDIYNSLEFALYRRK